MNYLAHLFLAEGREGWSVGALLGDYVKGRVPDELPPDLHFGIRLHRRIDAWSDSHPLFLENRALFSPSVRRYAGLYLDLAHDHFLLCHWSRFAREEVGAFISAQYTLLQETALPEAEGMRSLVARMVRLDMLGGYAEWGVILRALDGIATHRLRQPNRMAEGLEELSEHRDALEASFLLAFPDVIELVADAKGLETGRLGA